MTVCSPEAWQARDPGARPAGAQGVRLVPCSWLQRRGHLPRHLQAGPATPVSGPGAHETVMTHLALTPLRRRWCAVARADASCDASNRSANSLGDLGIVHALVYAEPQHCLAFSLGDMETHAVCTSANRPASGPFDAVGGWPAPLTPTGDTTGTVIAVGVSRADQRGFSGIIPRQAPERVHSAQATSRRADTRLCPASK